MSANNEEWPAKPVIPPDVIEASQYLGLLEQVSTKCGEPQYILWPLAKIFLNVGNSFDSKVDSASRRAPFSASLATGSRPPPAATSCALIANGYQRWCGGTQERDGPTACNGIFAGQPRIDAIAALRETLLNVGKA